MSSMIPDEPLVAGDGGLFWCFGPTEDDPSPEHRWHVECDGRIFPDPGGDYCTRCGATGETRRGPKRCSSCARPINRNDDHRCGACESVDAEAAALPV
jgi:hypothetical protein